MNTEKQKKFLIDFIDIFKSKPEIWKVKSDLYKNRPMKNEAYQCLVDKCKEVDAGADKVYVMKKISTLRATYRRELKKVNKSLKSGAGTDEEYVPSLWYYDHLHFLKDQEEPLDGECIGLESENEFEKTISPRRKTKKQKDEDAEADELIQLATKRLKRCDDYAQTVGNAWASEFRLASEEQQIFAKKAIDDILFEARLGTLSRGSVKIKQNILKELPQRFIASETESPSEWTTSTPKMTKENPSHHTRFSYHHNHSQSSQPFYDAYRPSARWHSNSSNEVLHESADYDCSTLSEQNGTFPITENNIIEIEDLPQPSQYSVISGPTLNILSPGQPSRSNLFHQRQKENHSGQTGPITITYNNISELLRSGEFNLK